MYCLKEWNAFHGLMDWSRGWFTNASTNASMNNLIAIANTNCQAPMQDMYNCPIPCAWISISNEWRRTTKSISLFRLIQVIALQRLPSGLTLLHLSWQESISCRLGCSFQDRWGAILIHWSQQMRLIVIEWEPNGFFSGMSCATCWTNRQFCC